MIVIGDALHQNIYQETRIKRKQNRNNWNFYYYFLNLNINTNKLHIKNFYFYLWHHKNKLTSWNPVPKGTSACSLVKCRIFSTRINMVSKPFLPLGYTVVELGTVKSISKITLFCTFESFSWLWCYNVIRLSGEGWRIYNWSSSIQLGSDGPQQGVFFTKAFTTEIVCLQWPNHTTT